MREKFWRVTVTVGCANYKTSILTGCLQARGWQSHLAKLLIGTLQLTAESASKPIREELLDVERASTTYYGDIGRAFTLEWCVSEISALFQENLQYALIDFFRPCVVLHPLFGSFTFVMHCPLRCVRFCFRVICFR